MQSLVVLTLSFQQLNIEMSILRPVKSTLMGFSRQPIQHKGRIALPVTIGAKRNSVTHMVDFMVVDMALAYYLIIGRSILNKIGSVVCTYHLKMKFLIGEGVEKVRGSQQAARECYNRTLKSSKETPIEIYAVDNVDVWDEDKLVQGEPVEDLIKVELELGRSERVIKLGVTLDPKIKLEVLEFL